MIEQIYNYFTIEMLYLWINLGVLPLWFLIIFLPQSQLCRYLATSIFPVFLLGVAYSFVLYKSYLNSYDFLGNFSLYLGIEYVSDLFEDNLYLLLLWIHFVSINLFIGGWILKDSQKFFINKFLIALPLIITYLIGPIGLFVYWIIRIFYAKRLSLYE
jgi:hypothetical protein|tara:strand:- start:1656 stop:2129 length:474 start_codon:yes stop_codon:yes gene_type:complete